MFGGFMGGASGIIGKIGNTFGGGAPVIQDQEVKNYTSALTYMNTFQGKNIIMTGATGAIGSKVAKKLLKAGARIVMLV